MTAGFYHCSVKGVGRAAGRSVVAAAAYRSGERLADEITGKTADYRARGGVVETFILTRNDAPAWAHDRERLWNEAERAETRANGRLATEFELALPHELDAAGRKQLLKDYLAPFIEKHGMAADVAIHEPGEGRDHRNVHAHVLLTHRTLDADGFGDIANTRNMTRMRKGQEVPEQIAGIAATPADIRGIRKAWEQELNRAYEREGLDIRADHRSHKDRGIEQEPTKHLGPTASEMEQKRPGSSERGEANREITQRNADRQAVATLEAEVKELSAQIIDLNADRAMQASYDGARGRYEPLRETHREVEQLLQQAAAERAMQEARDAAKGRIDDVRPNPTGDRLHQRDDTVQPATSPEMRDAAERGIPTYPAAPENAPDVTATRPIVAPEPETARTAEPEQTAALTPDDSWAVDPLTPDEIRSIGGILGGILDGISKPFEGIISALGDMFSPAPPPASKDEAEREQQAAREQREQAAAAEREAAEREAAFQALVEQLRGDDERLRQREDGERGRERQRERDDDRGRELER
jgi:hypothetical protein